MTKKLFRFIASLLVPTMGALLIRVLYMSNKVNFYAPKELEEENFIMACWHGELLMIPYAYMYFRKSPKVKLLISDHFDGALIAKTLGFFGFGTIRGSSNKNAVKALLMAIKELKGGGDLGITPDGPKGPRHNVADGIVIMAQKAKKKVVLVEIISHSFWQLNSWDKFIIPKPFSRIDYYISDAIDLSSLSKEEAKEQIKEGLLRHERVST